MKLCIWKEGGIWYAARERVRPENWKGYFDPGYEMEVEDAWGEEFLAIAERYNQIDKELQSRAERRHEALLATEDEREERAELARLSAKYGASQ